MKIILDLPESLINEAMELTHTDSHVAVIIKALEELVRKSKNNWS